MSSVPERTEVDEEYRWDLGSLFVSDERWEQAYEDVEAELDDLRAYEGRVTEDAETLARFLDRYQEVMRDVENVATYARLRRDEDTRNDEAQAMATQARSLFSEAQSATSFLDPEIQQLDREDVEEMMETVPELREYDHYFDDVLRQKPHTRSSEVENLLAELGEVTGAPGEIYNMLSNADMEFPVVETPDGGEKRITLNNFTTLLKNPDREFRQRVYEAYFGEWETVHNAVGTAYRNSVKTNEKLADARNYDSARQASLDDPNIPVEVYDTLVDTVRDNLGTLHRHADLKREAIGADELRMWDLYVPMVEGDGPEVPYEDACEYVTEAVAPLGDAYQSRLAEGLDSRWVDVYETEGKQSGGYSSGTYDSQPYILLNYQDDVSSMYTLAHELGHSMHSELASETQPYVYASYTLFVAEIASTVNETLLTHHLLETVEDERLRRHVLNEYLERFRSVLFRQTMFAEFEHRVHERSESGEPLTPDRLDELFRDIKSDYYEPAVVDDHIAREWMRIPHFYRAFYVFQYATGISAAVALVEAIREEGEPAPERYREFLRSGSRDYPLDLLDEAGVDLTEATPIEQAIDVYESSLDEFEQLM
ncbi:oligoendopeptidase F [Halobacteriales archaeon QH_2_65_14]|nr:MAG: oligoendopeptidase F [Halobacteriales archaeon QH_2_65_14]